MAKRKQSSQEKALRRYFRSRSRKAGWLVLLGILVLGAGVVLAEDTDSVSLIPGPCLIALGFFGLFLAALGSRPSDKKVDGWLEPGYRPDRRASVEQARPGPK